MQIGLLREWASKMAHNIVQEFGENGKYKNGFPIFVYSGMSGIATATAVSLNLPKDFKFGMMYIRKEHEESHGREVERAACRQTEGTPVIVFCDDFICEGGTLSHVLCGIQKNLEQKIILKNVLCALSDRADVTLINVRVSQKHDGNLIKKVSADLKASAIRVKEEIAERRNNNPLSRSKVVSFQALNPSPKKG
jgi:hypothetical protein